jgi:predicted dehydrogenase
MGLNERRKIKELQETTFPGRVQEIQEICGKPIPYEVDWESLADDAEGLNFIDNLSCHRLNMALRVICSDEMGKEAVRDGLRLIKLKNVKDKAAMSITFEGGVLEMHCAVCAAHGRHVQRPRDSRASPEEALISTVLLTAVPR